MNGAIITIDSNEIMHHPEFADMQWEGALTLVGNLEFGDIKIQYPDGDIVLIERKAPADFLSSIKDRRLFNQVAGMVEKTKWTYVLVDGLFVPDSKGKVWINNTIRLKNETGWDWHAIQGVLLSIQEMGASIIYDPDFHGAIGRIGNRSRSSVKIAPRRDAYVFSPNEKILTAFDGIGLVKAQKYLELFSDNVALALTGLTAPHDGKKNYIDGWGQRSRDKFVNQLGGRVEYKADG